MNRTEEEDYIKGKRQRLRELLELEEYNLRIELQQKQEAQKFGILNNLREQVKEIRQEKMQRDICQNNQKSSRGEFDPRQAVNACQAREQYGNDLKEQIRVKEENLAKLKKEDDQYQKIMKEMEAKEMEKDKLEQLRRRNMQLQYTNDLKNQLSDVTHKKEVDLKIEKSNVYNVNDQTSNEYANFGVDSNSPSVLMKKQQNRDEYKKALDEQLMSNLKIKDEEKRDTANEHQDTFHIGAKDITEAQRHQMQVHEQKDQDEYLQEVRDQKEISVQEELILEKCYNDHSVSNAEFKTEEDKKKQELFDRNKQYQADLLAQIKEKKERKSDY